MMKCPFCPSKKRKVIDSRLLDGFVYRRSLCLKCGKKYTTNEIVQSGVKPSVNHFVKTNITMPVVVKNNIIKKKPIVKNNLVKKHRRYIDESTGYNELTDILKEIRGY